MAEQALELRGLKKWFGSHQAVASLDLRVAQGEFVTLLGPSGCGKTTTLNMIAGFVSPDSGSIHLAGRPVQSLAPFRRDLGIVFQDYALFPHRTVAENIAFGLRMRKVNRVDIVRRVAEAMQMVRLDGLGERRPQQLSGGQRQRVALARALVIRPALLLLDEPLSNLDLKLREEMRTEISALQRRLGIATVFVTHDQEEALTMSDRIAVMRAGKVEQLGNARDIYEAPASAFVATFIGTTNMIRAHVTGPADHTGRVTLQTPFGPASLSLGRFVSTSGSVVLTIRPERLKLALRGEGSVAGGAGATVWPGRIIRIVYLGSRMEVHLTLPDRTTAIANIVNDGSTTWAAGEEADIWFGPADVWVVPAEDNPA
jgi:putative spermidine/putrescine transport system ATP-binding protein